MPPSTIHGRSGRGLRVVSQGALEVAKRNREDGIAVLLSLFYTLLVLGLVLTTISGRRLPESSRHADKVHRPALRHLSEAGLTQALHEIRKCKTLDRAEGRQWTLSYPMGGLLWGSVEVTLDRRQRLLLSTAAVHERADLQEALDAYPNKLLARGGARVHLGRIRFRPPAKAPLILARPDLLALDADLTLLTRQGEAALAYVGKEGQEPDLPPDALAIELPAESLDLVHLLGIRTVDLGVMADRTVPEGEGFEEMKWGLTHLSGEHRFGSQRPLRGHGLLVVEGDLVLDGNARHEFQGILLVLGDLKLRGRAHFTGMTIVWGALQVLRQGNDSGLSVEFDEECLRRALWSVEGIRFSERPEIFVEEVKETATQEDER